VTGGGCGGGGVLLIIRTSNEQVILEGGGERLPRIKREERNMNSSVRNRRRKGKGLRGYERSPGWPFPFGSRRKDATELLGKSRTYLYVEKRDDNQKIRKMGSPRQRKIGRLKRRRGKGRGGPQTIEDSKGRREKGKAGKRNTFEGESSSQHEKKRGPRSAMSTVNEREMSTKDI